VNDQALKQIFEESAERTRKHLDDLRQEVREERETWTRRANSHFILRPEWLDERLVRLEESLAALHRKIDDLQASLSAR
jgi:uncharacterized protein YukE